MKQVQRIIEPLIIYAGSTAAILSAGSDTFFSNAQPIVAVFVGLATLAYTVLKIIQISRELFTKAIAKIAPEPARHAPSPTKDPSPYRRKRDRKPQGKNNHNQRSTSND